MLMKQSYFGDTENISSERMVCVCVNAASEKTDAGRRAVVIERLSLSKKKKSSVFCKSTDCLGA